MPSNDVPSARAKLTELRTYASPPMFKQAVSKLPTESSAALPASSASAALAAVVALAAALALSALFATSAETLLVAEMLCSAETEYVADVDVVAFPRTAQHSVAGSLTVKSAVPSNAAAVPLLAAALSCKVMLLEALSFPAAPAVVAALAKAADKSLPLLVNVNEAESTETCAETEPVLTKSAEI